MATITGFAETLGPFFSLTAYLSCRMAVTDHVLVRSAASPLAGLQTVGAGPLQIVYTRL